MRSHASNVRYILAPEFAWTSCPIRLPLFTRELTVSTRTRAFSFLYNLRILVTRILGKEIEIFKFLSKKNFLTWKIIFSVISHKRWKIENFNNDSFIFSSYQEMRILDVIERNLVKNDLIDDITRWTNIIIDNFLLFITIGDYARGSW